MRHDDIANDPGNRIDLVRRQDAAQDLVAKVLILPIRPILQNIAQKSVHVLTKQSRTAVNGGPRQ